MHCPVCGTQYAFFEKKCTKCNVDLVPDGESGEPSEPMVRIDRRVALPAGGA